MSGLIVLVVIVAIVAILACKGQSMCNDIRGEIIREGLDGIERQELAHTYMFGAGAMGGACPRECPTYRYAAPRDCRADRFTGPNSPECIWTAPRSGFVVMSPGSTTFRYGTQKCDPFDRPYC